MKLKPKTFNLIALAALAVVLALKWNNNAKTRSAKETAALQKRADHYEELANKVMAERDRWIAHLRGDKKKLQADISQLRTEIAKLEMRFGENEG